MFSIAASTRRPSQWGDFNGDGLPDAAIINNKSNNVLILLGKGDGTVQAPTMIPINQPTALAVADFDSDGSEDLVIAGGTNALVILNGNGDGTFQAPVALPPVGTGPLGITTADFTGDGRPDLAVLCMSENATVVSVLVGGADGTFTRSANLPVGGTGVGPMGGGIAAADLNGDGKQDLVAIHPFDTGVSVFPGNGNGTIGAPATVATGALRPAAVGLADFNGDGKLDIAVSGFGGGSGPGILLGDGKGGFATVLLLGNTLDDQEGLAIADFDGDGLPDLAATSFMQSAVQVLLNTLSSKSSAVFSGVAPGQTVLTSDPGSAVFGASKSANVVLQ